MKTIITLILFLFGMNTFAQTTFIAHRGASNLAPENTLAAVQKAWDIGADAVEIDIHLSKDNRVMVIHDKSTKRTCSGKKNLDIANTPSMLLRDLDAGVWKGDEFKGEKIPFLSEVIETIPEGKTLVIEIKCNKDVMPSLQRAIQKSGKQDQLVFISFGWQTILAAHETFPENKCYWLSSLKPGLKKKMIQVAEEGISGVNLKHSLVDDEIMTLAHENELEVLAWTIDDKEEAERLIELGVTKITTNKPLQLKEELSKQ